MISPHADSLLHHTQPDGKTPRAERRGGLANPRARASRTQERGAGRQGCPLCSRTAHSGLIRSGHRRMECSVDARNEGQPSHPPPENIRWMVCRVPVALLTATGDDARSLRRPGHQPEKKRKDHAVPACPLLCQFQPRPEPGSPIQAGRARLTRPRGRAPLMCAAVTRARPDHFGLSQQAEADRRTPTMWGMGRAAAGLPLVTAARRACAERNASPCRPWHEPLEGQKSHFLWRE